MLRVSSALTAVALALLLIATASAAPGASVHKKHHVSRHSRYGFLPGYRPPEVIERARAEHYYEVYGPTYYGPAWPGFYNNRWNGGGFGPCYTQTPIGPIWNCGR